MIQVNVHSLKVKLKQQLVQTSSMDVYTHLIPARVAFRPLCCSELGNEQTNLVLAPFIVT